MEIYNQDGSLEATVTDIMEATVDVFGSRKVLRSFSCSIDDHSGLYTPDPDQFDRNVLWYNKTAKVFYGYKTGNDNSTEEYLPQGVFTIDSIKPIVTPEGVELQISGQDLISKLIEDKFDDVYTVEDAAGSESANYALANSGSSAAATSSISAGDEIQTQSRIHYVDTFATVNGLETDADNESLTDPHQMLDSTITTEEPEWGHCHEGSNYQGSLSGFGYTGGFAWDSNANDASNVGRSIGARFDNKVTFKSFELRDSDSTSRIIAADIKVHFSNENSTWTEITDISKTIDTVDGRARVKVDIHDNISAKYWKFSCDAPDANYTFRDLGGFQVWCNEFNQPPYILEGWRYQYTPGSGETVSQIEAEIFVDLQSKENIQEITINLVDGAELTDFVYVSPDNASWTQYASSSFDPAGQVRFIKFRSRKTSENADGSWSMGISEIQVKTSDSFSPDLSIDSDIYNTHWRPGITDPDPVLTINFGSSRTFNALYLYWGKDSFDFWNRSKYYLEHSADGISWTRITDLNSLDESSSMFGDVEHVFDPITASHIRISIKGRDGVCKLRHVKCVNVTATEYVDKVIKDVLVTAGVTSHNIPRTRRWIKKKMAEIGDDKEDFCRDVAAAIGWINPVMDENGVYTTGPRDINPVDLAWEFSSGSDNIFSYSPRFSNDIKNVIVVIYKDSGARSVVGRAIDDDPLSPTYTEKLGRRVQVYEGEMYNTQEKCDIMAEQKLFEKTRFKHRTSLPVTGHPALQVDDAVTVTIPETNITDYYYLITGYTTSFVSDSAQFDTRINISQL